MSEARVQEDVEAQVQNNPPTDLDRPIALRRGRRTKGAYRAQDHHPEAYAVNTPVEYGPHLHGICTGLSWSEPFSLVARSL